jgi:RNA polymerase sigma factor (sigma-70 family)
VPPTARIHEAGEHVQAELTGTPAPDETSDAVLLLRTREGDTEAFGSLYLRHVAAARVLARQLARDPSEVDELVAESFTRVLGVLQRGAGPEAALRPYLLSTMRRLHIDRRVAERKTEPTDDLSAHDPGEPFVDRAADELERTIVSSAFTSLPERWRLVLWHTEVEGLSPAQVAPLLGISANATAALAVRARAGLRDAYLTAHVSDATEPGCREIGPSLGGYVRGTLSRRERAAVDAHLDSCARCSAAVLELSDTAATMRAIIGPLILGSAVLAYREGLLALGPHAIPSFALLHAGGAVAGTGTGTGAGTGPGGGSGSGSGAANAGRPTWQLAAAAGVAGAVVIAAAVAYALAGGSPADTASGRPAPGSTSAQPSSTAAPSTSAPTPTPSPSSGSTSPSSTSSPGNPQVNPVAQTSTTSPAGPASPTSSASPTSALPALQAPAPSQVTLLTVGDLVAGRDNVLELTTTNPDPSPVTQGVDLTLPPGVSLSSTTTALRAAGRASNAALLFGAAAAAGPCSRTTQGASCTLGLVAPGASATLRIPVTLASNFSTGALSVTVTSRDGARTASVTVDRTFTVTPGGVSTAWAGHGRYQVSAGGASLLSCQDDKTPVKGCAEAEARKLPGHQDNNDWKMVAINDAGDPWTTSSSSTVDLPKGSTVVAAWLSWSASGLAKDANPVHTASIAGPAGKPSTVTAKTWDALDLASASTYVATADVTALVQAQGGGSWTVGDSALSSGQTSIYAGWSLTVITTSAAAPVRDVTVLTGPFSIIDASHAWSGHAPGLSGQGADLTLVAWEGDADLTGDSLSVHGKPVAPLDAPGVSDNVAASAALGAKRAVSFGVDVRQLSAPAGDGDDLSVTTDGDTWLLGMLVISAGDGAGL